MNTGIHDLIKRQQNLLNLRYSQLWDSAIDLRLEIEIIELELRISEMAPNDFQLVIDDEHLTTPHLINRGQRNENE